MVAVSRSSDESRDGLCLRVRADVADPGDAKRAVDAAMTEFGRLDVLVNNAALDLAKPLEETTPEETRQIFDVNALGPLWMIQAAIPALSVRGGAVVNVTSRLAHVGVPEMAIYGASKGALRALTHGAAVELAPLRIRVNAVAPGMIDTPLFHEWLEQKDNGEAARQDVVNRIPLGRLAGPADVARAILYLASDAAEHITGITLPVDGGYTAA